jgi:Fe-S-cluster containining protein
MITEAVIASRLSRRESLCLGCREKICCSYYTVTVTGLDVWRIARTMQLAPTDFLAYRATDGPGPGRFQLAPGEAYFELLLAKRPLPEPLPSPCVFLVRTNDEHALCGLGPLRPGQCRAYPVYVADDVVNLINDPDGCVRTWSYADVDLDEERDRSRGLAAEEAEHRRMVGEWNARVAESGRARSFDDFCAYLLNRCAALGAEQ